MSHYFFFVFFFFVSSLSSLNFSLIYLVYTILFDGQRSTSLAVGGGAFQGLAKGADVFGRDVVLAHFSASHVHPETAIVALDHGSAGERSAAEASYGVPRLIRLKSISIFG